MRLIAERLGLERGGRGVLSGLDLSIAAGEALVVTGPNGAGKTTLLRALAGLLAPSSGAVRIEGGDPDLPLTEHAHLIGHRDGVKDSLTAAENLAFWRGLLGGRGSIEGALGEVGLLGGRDLPAYALSAGQRRRLALARLLVAPRSIWLLDEPMTALDAAAQARLRALVQRHRGQGGIAAAATHADLGWPDARELRLTGGDAHPPPAGAGR